MELLQSSCVRPRQARYQAAPRPDMKCAIHSKALPNFAATPILQILSLDRSCTRIQRHLIGQAVHLLQGFLLHLQLHLSILFKEAGEMVAKGNGVLAFLRNCEII
jgi:hypothetical protein